MTRKKDDGKDKATEPEVMSPGAAMGGSVGEELAMAVAGGGNLVMLENERMFSIAIQRPRDEEKVCADMLAIIKRSTVFAEDAIYSKPVGKEFNPATREYDGPMKYAEGFSIRFAEELRRVYGNNGVAGTIAGDTPDGTVLAGVFVDYERGTRFVIQKVAPRSYKTAGGGVRMHPPDRYTDIVVPRNMSVVLRETILRAAPAWIKSECEVAIRNKRSKVKPEVRRKKIIDAFQKIGVTVAHLEAYLGKKIDDTKNRDLDILQGLGVAFKEGDLTADEVFGIKSKPEGTAAAASDPGVGDGLKVKGANGTTGGDQGGKDPGATDKGGAAATSEPAKTGSGSASEPAKTAAKESSAPPKDGDDPFPGEKVPNDSVDVGPFLHKSTSEDDLRRRFDACADVVNAMGPRMKTATETLYQDLKNKLRG